MGDIWRAETTMAVPVHFGVLPNRPIEEIAELPKRAEELGFAGVWVADSQSIFCDVFCALTLADRVPAPSTGVAAPHEHDPPWTGWWKRIAKPWHGWPAISRSARRQCAKLSASATTRPRGRL